jgi:uncharacterized protein (TIGR02145 family)
LDVSSTNKVFLPPRMTTTQRNLIAIPPAGGVIFNTTTNCLQWFTGQVWYDGCSGQEFWAPGYNHCNASNETQIQPVINPVTNRTWMDRNLGANRVATGATDNEAFGSFFQWGRRADGHQCFARYSGDGITSSPNSAIGATESTDTPQHNIFIRVNTTPNDWRSPQNTNLWQGVVGVNNPCPVGYRLPTEAEWNIERLSWVAAPISSTNNANGAFDSPLKLTVGGFRRGNKGLSNSVGVNGSYWSSTVNGLNSRGLNFTFTTAGNNSYSRSQGFSVRCIKH